MVIFLIINVYILYTILIRYMKGRDPANWITVDSATGEIRLAEKLDYESPYVVNGTYTITMLGVTTGKLRRFCFNANWFVEGLVCLSAAVVGLTSLSLRVRSVVRPLYLGERRGQLSEID